MFGSGGSKVAVDFLTESKWEGVSGRRKVINCAVPRGLFSPWYLRSFLFVKFKCSVCHWWEISIYWIYICWDPPRQFYKHNGRNVFIQTYLHLRLFRDLWLQYAERRAYMRSTHLSSDYEPIFVDELNQSTILPRYMDMGRISNILTSCVTYFILFN